VRFPAPRLRGVARDFKFAFDQLTVADSCVRRMIRKSDCRTLVSISAAQCVPTVIVRSMNTSWPSALNASKIFAETASSGSTFRW
jgi:hypothetical protein